MQSTRSITATAVRGSGASLNVPPTQNTAPVHEYRCLWTHDVRRKQKRWQDGRLKFHTFNRRLMLYDDALTYIGDTHWKEGGELAIDDEVMLDIAVLMQIGERVATTQTDLAPLFDKDARKAQQAAAKDAAKSIVHGTETRTLLGGKSNLQKPANGDDRKHRSLNALLGSDRGSYGRASFPAKSPYETRKDNQENETAGERPAKRHQTMGNRTAVSQTRTSFPKTPLWARTSDESVRQGSTSVTHNQMHDKIGMGRNSQVLIPSGSDNQPWSDVTLPSSPHRHGDAVKRPLPKSNSAKKALMLPPRTPKASIARRNTSSSPPISTKSHIRHVESEIEVVVIDDGDGTAAEVPSTDQVPKVTKTKSLLTGKSNARPMLVCQISGGSTRSKKKGVQKTKRNGQNLYRTLSQLEEEGEAEEAQAARGPVYGRAKIAKPRTKDGYPTKAMPVEASSETAFETVSSPPGLKLVAQFSNSKMKTAMPSHSQCRDSNKKGTGGIVTVIDDREDSGVAMEPGFANGRCPPKAKSRMLTAPAAQAPKSKSTNQQAYEDSTEPSKGNQALSRGKIVELPKAKEEQGPWTVEAMDLFDWRPPDWEGRLKSWP